VRNNFDFFPTLHPPTHTKQLKEKESVATALRRMKADKDISSDQVRWLLCCSELQCVAVLQQRCGE